MANPRKARKLHIEITPVVEVDFGAHRVRFDGLTLLRPHVMVEYEATPPLRTDDPFGPHLLWLEATDDFGGEYPVSWPAFQWPWRGAGRMTTRLDRRPSPNATRLKLVVRPVERPGPDGEIP